MSCYFWSPFHDKEALQMSKSEALNYLDTFCNLSFVDGFEKELKDEELHLENSAQMLERKKIDIQKRFNETNQKIEYTRKNLNDDQEIEIDAEWTNVKQNYLNLKKK